MKLIKFIPIILFTILSIFLYKKIDNYETTKSLSSALIDKPFPLLNLNSFNEEQDISNIVGKKFFVVNFFASWCLPCKVEHNVLKYFSDQVDIVGIAYKDSTNNIENYLLEFGNPYKYIYLDNNGKNAIELGLYGVPETYFVDNKGVIKYKHVGPITLKQFRNIISFLGI